MKPVADILKGAEQAIGDLRERVFRGDVEAVRALIEIGNEASRLLAGFSTFPPGHAGRIAADTAARTAREWPVRIPAIEELRPPSPTKDKLRKTGPPPIARWLPAMLGDDLPFETKKSPTNARTFDHDSQTGFAYDAFLSLDHERNTCSPWHREALRENWEVLTDEDKADWRNLAALLPPLSRDPKTLADWAEAGTRWAEWGCDGQWKTFPWPAEVIKRSEQMTNTSKRGIETAVRDKLLKGFGSLARRLPLIRGE